MNEYKNALKIAGVYTGLVIGAGFASGREVITFFTSYGSIWPIGMIFSGVMFSALGWIILNTIEKENIQTYKDFLKTVMGERFAALTEVVTGIFLCILFFAMVSACGSLVNEAFGVDRIWGSAFLSFLCFIVFTGGVEKLIGINTLLAPLMIFGTVVVCILTFFTQTKDVIAINTFTDNIPVFIFFSATIYVSYNVISSVPVFVQTGSLIKKDKKAKYGAVLGGAAMAALGIMMGVIVLVDGMDIVSFDIPVLAIINNRGSLIKYIYIIVILGAIVTTAVGNGYGAIKWIESYIGIKRNIISLFFCISAFILSFVGFSGFTDKIYPLFGFIGLAEMFFIFKYFLKDK